jgi:hypothetical protein
MSNSFSQEYQSLRLNNPNMGLENFGNDSVTISPESITPSGVVMRVRVPHNSVFKILRGEEVAFVIGSGGLKEDKVEIKEIQNQDKSLKVPREFIREEISQSRNKVLQLFNREKSWFQRSPDIADINNVLSQANRTLQSAADTTEFYKAQAQIKDTKIEQLMNKNKVCISALSIAILAILALAINNH